MPPKTDQTGTEDDTGRRWRRRKQARPQEILAAALAVFGERGFAAARLEDVAERAGVSKGTVYLYFSGKEELFKALVREAIVPNLDRALRRLAEHPGSSAELLRAVLGDIAGLIATQPIGVIPKLIVAEAGNFPELARFYRTEVVQRGLGLFASIIARGIARGEFRPVDPQHAAKLCVAPLLLVVMWKHAIEPSGGAPLDVMGYMATYLDVLLGGLLAPGGTS